MTSRKIKAKAGPPPAAKDDSKKTTARTKTKTKAEAGPPPVAKETAKKKGQGQWQGQMRGFLHCAADGETVRRFGRNDDFVSGFGEEQATARTRAKYRGPSLRSG